MAIIRPQDKALRRDVRMLGKLLGDVLVEQEGQGLFELEERVRQLAVARRRGPKPGRSAAASELSELLAGLSIDEAEPVVRAFAMYFQLVNLAEQHHRIRRARSHMMEPGETPQRGSIEAVLRTLKERGVGPERIREALHRMQVTLTLTAHPTQAVRRTLLEKVYRLAGLLEQRDRTELTFEEAARLQESMREEITTLWQTDELRRERPTVGDEVKTALWYVEEVLWDMLGELPQGIARAFERVFGEPFGEEFAPLRLHSWVGGDMDGHPLVTPEVLADTLRAQRIRGLRRLLTEVQRLGGRLSQSERRIQVTAALAESLEQDAKRMPKVAERRGPRSLGEPFRRKLNFMEARLQAAITEAESARGALEPSGSTEDGVPYASADELCADLERMEEALQASKGQRAGFRLVRALRLKVAASGLSLVELEMRVPAEDAQNAAASIRSGSALSDGGRRVLAALAEIARAQKESGEGSCRTLILSMTHTADDVLAALACARHAGLANGTGVSLDIVPLLESGDALESGPELVRTLLRHPEYRPHVLARGVQEVMVGYSDSGKEIGLLAAAALLYRVQSQLPSVAREEGVRLRIFHGRGESVARGGGPAQAGILALPPGSVNGLYKATEQGEALDHKYSRPELARRTLELIVGGVLLHSLDEAAHPPKEVEAGFIEAFEKMAEIGRKAYRELVWENPHFLDFFQNATPLEEIASLPIGSRPSKRKAGGLETLRAIPWVFSWTQNRAILPGWYGVGAALEAMRKREGGASMLERMYRQWPFFQTVIDNIEMVLAKSDLEIAARYARLAPRDTLPVWRAIRDEHARTRTQVMAITGSRRLLDGNKPLQRSIALRNPYVDPMSFLQVELMQRKRAGAPNCERPLLLTLGGIAAGLRNTG